MRNGLSPSIFLATVGLVALGAQVSGGSPSGPCKPDCDCKPLQAQINKLKAQIDSLSGRVEATERQLRPASYDVTCPGGSISAVLAEASTAAPVRIFIHGTCEEEVLISRDDVTLQGGGADAIAAPPGAGSALRVEGAQRVSLSDLLVVGGAWTVSLSRGASVTAYNLRIRGGSYGGLALNSSSAYLQDSEITDTEMVGAHLTSGSSLILWASSVVDNHRQGVFVEGSVATLVDTTVARNGEDAVFVRNGRATIDGGRILDNGAFGVVLEWGDARLDRTLVAGNVIGVQANFGSVASLNATIQANGNGAVGALGGSVISLGGATAIDGGQNPGIRLSDTSTAGGWGTPTVSGSPFGILCAAPPSVAQLTGDFILNGTTNCQSAQ